MVTKDTLFGGNTKDFATIFGLIFLTIFAGLIIYVMSKADFSTVLITGSISVEMLMGTFIGIVIAVIGFLGITKGKVQTNNTA